MQNQFRRRKGGFAPGFKPVGEVISPTSATNSSTGIGEWVGTKRVAEDSKSQGTGEKKTKLSRYGLKFQSAGTLISIGDVDGIGKDTPIVKETMPIVKKATPRKTVQQKSLPKDDSHGDRRGAASTERQRKMIDEKKASYTTKWEKAGASKPEFLPTPSKDDSAPPPLMSRQRELTMEKYADHTSDDEEADFTTKAIIKKAPKFKFKIHPK